MCKAGKIIEKALRVLLLLCACAINIILPHSCSHEAQVDVYNIEVGHFLKDNQGFC